jgi:hypothetical protein
MGELAKLAQSYRAGEAAGGALPNGADLRFRGMEGALPDVLASLRYDDKQMAARFLAMFTKLCTTETGSRALGSPPCRPAGRLHQAGGVRGRRSMPAGGGGDGVGGAARGRRSCRGSTGTKVPTGSDQGQLCAHYGSTTVEGRKLQNLLARWRCLMRNEIVVGGTIRRRVRLRWIGRLSRPQA